MSRAGFTLIEVTVALTVAALLAVAAHRGLNTLAELQGRAAERRGEALQAAAIRRQLAEWLRSAYLGEEPGRWRFEGVDRRSAGGTPDDALLFSTLQPDPFRDDAALVEIGLARGSGHRPGLIAALRYDDAAPSAIASHGSSVQGDRFLLVPRATGLDIRYLARVEQDRWWVPSWASRVRLPDAVELRILGDEVPPLLQLPILVPLVSGG